MGVRKISLKKSGTTPHGTWRSRVLCGIASDIGRSNGDFMMKIKKILVGIIFSAVMLLTACSGGDTQMSEEEKALQQQLIGVWFYPDSAVYDNDGDLTGFSAYQFTDEVIKCHDVGNGQIMSYALNLYTIKDDKIVVNNDGQRQYALISVKEVDGKDHLFWDIDTKTMEFIRMTDEEIEEYGIPVDKMLSSEAELLGIETEPSDANETVTVTSMPSISELNEAVNK